MRKAHGIDESRLGQMVGAVLAILFFLAAAAAFILLIRSAIGAGESLKARSLEQREQILWQVKSAPR